MAEQVQQEVPTETLLLRCKTVFLGEPTVGKSALVSQFHSNMTKYPKAYAMTTGVEICEKEVTTEIQPSNGLINKINFHLFDCGGNELFKDIAAQACPGANVVVYCFNMAKKESFDRVADWVSRFSVSPAHLKKGQLFRAAKTFPVEL
mmetsp:Transcript_42105/g.108363  ORF Transcript_42105/g.108363 Transcript_42105/m.108363 type:complete len:148 (-) Transcript_42105:1865-2308(-)